MSFKICVIGCGWVADAMHGPAYARYKSENPGTVLAGCCDTNAERAGAFKNKYGFLSAYADMKEMLAKEKPDAVCLNAPVHLTASLAAEILETGVPLLLEKPPGRTKEEVARLMEIAERKNVPHRVAFNRRYSPLVRKTKEILDGIDGKIQGLQYDMYRVGRADADFSTTAIHAIDTARHIAGSDYANIQFAYRDYPELGENVADIRMLCTMKNGAAVSINICPVTGIDIERAAINLPDTSCFLDFLGNPLNPSGRLTMVTKNAIALDIEGKDAGDGAERYERDGFWNEDKTFFDDIQAGRKPDGGLASALQSVEAAESVRNRAREVNFA
ncbi:MAG: Gfo/Idh/MocA family oxidoreductase [Defluviitaleaceae bacterium]|nr:Gfo/Idh/MocA family oxidoreductase [Defluviitaleaceae bacterium]